MYYADKLYFNGVLAKNVVIPDGVKTIKPFTFFSCDSMQSIKIPSSVTAIGTNTFDYCYNLKDIYTPYIASWCKIKFSGSPALYANNLYFGKTLAKTLTIPSTVKKISRGAFAGLECIETLIIPKSVTDIDFYAFNGCNNLKTICYAGSKEAWYEIEFKHNADVLYNGLKKPATPTGLSATQTSATVTLKWKKVSGATGYGVFKYDEKTGQFEKIKTTTATSYKVSKLSPATTYAFVVKACKKKDDQTGWSDPTKELIITTKPTAPSISKISTTKGKVNLLWNDVKGEDGYEVYYSTKKDSGFSKVGVYVSDKKTASKTKLTSGKTYYFKVRAYKVGFDGKAVYSAWSAVNGIKVK